MRWGFIALALVSKIKSLSLAFSSQSRREGLIIAKEKLFKMHSTAPS